MFQFKFTFKELMVIICCLLAFIFSLEIFENSAVNNFKNTTKQPTYFGATYMNLSNDFFSTLDSEISRLIESKDDILISLDAGLSLTKQKEQMRYLIQQGCEIIFLSPVDLEGLNSVIEECNAKGIIVITVDSGVTSEYVQYNVVSDNYQAGVLIAEEIINTFDTGNILVLEHATAQSAIDRIDGFLDTIYQYEQFNIVDILETEGLLETAMYQVLNVLESGKSIDVVMSLNDQVALGALAAIHMFEAEGVRVYGIDGSPDAKQLIANNLMEGTVAQYPIQIASESVELAYQALEGNIIDNIEIVVEVTMINQENISEYNIEGWQ